MLAILCKLVLDLGTDFSESICLIYGSPLGGKTKICCKFGEGIANLHAP